MATTPTLFCRIGWMRFYRNLMPGDEDLVGGGRFNQNYIGSEVANFLPWDGKLYGYAQPAMNSGYRIALERIVAGASDVAKLTGVTVVFVARHPDEGGQRVVGWYRDATVLRSPMKNSPHRAGKGRWHNILSTAEKAVLVPRPRRTCVIPTGTGAMGQSNVFYPLEQSGKSRNLPWMRRAIRFIETYDGPNTMLNPAADEEEEVARGLQSVIDAAEGQGFAQSPVERRRIERHAMRRAIKHFRRLFTRVEDVSASQSYDLHCSEAGQSLKVEVKGTTGSGRVVLFTPNEIRLAAGGGMALFVLHSIKLKNGHPFGGTARVIRPWTADRRRLTPVGFQYRLP